MTSFRPRTPRGPAAASAAGLALALALNVSCSSDEIAPDGSGGASSMGGATSQAGTLNGNTPVMCSSGETWKGGDRGSPLMQPGRACLTCHAMNDNSPRFAVAGTVYPTAHEPDDCNGVNAASKAVIRLTDGDNVTHELGVNDAGNFYVPADLPTPYRATVVARGLERAMVAPQTSGDCNSCHTEAGLNGSPGRIVAP